MNFVSEMKDDGLLSQVISSQTLMIWLEGTIIGKAISFGIRQKITSINKRFSINEYPLALFTTNLKEIANPIVITGFKCSGIGKLEAFYQ